MTSRVLNFLWLNLDLPAPPDPWAGSIREPMPEDYIDNIRDAAARHPKADIVLWIDSKRLTEKQVVYLQDAVERNRPNLRLKDLRDIPAYNDEPLYNEPETDPMWRWHKNATIWRQVDAAKVLVSLQGNYDQTFFADFDHAHLDIESLAVQKRIRKHGVMVGSMSAKDTDIENQLWGFDGRRRGFFAAYYIESLKDAYENSNAWATLVHKVENQLLAKEHLDRADIILPIDDDYSEAWQPGHIWREGHGSAASPSLISRRRVAQAFNRLGRKVKHANPVSAAARAIGRYFHQTIRPASR